MNSAYAWIHLCLDTHTHTHRCLPWVILFSSISAQWQDRQHPSVKLNLVYVWCALSCRCFDACANLTKRIVYVDACQSSPRAWISKNLWVKTDRRQANMACTRIHIGEMFYPRYQNAVSGNKWRYPPDIWLLLQLKNKKKTKQKPVLEYSNRFKQIMSV